MEGFNRSIKGLLAWLFWLGIKLLHYACAVMLSCRVMWHKHFKRKNLIQKWFFLIWIVYNLFLLEILNIIKIVMPG